MGISLYAKQEGNQVFIDVIQNMLETPGGFTVSVMMTAELTVL